METLPDEIFEAICLNLPKRDLLNMMLVDRYSRFIIENSPVLMRNLPLYVDDEVEDEFDVIEGPKLIEPLMDSRKKIMKVVIDLKREKIMKFLGIFKKFGESIRILVIKRYRFETIDQLRIILRYLTNLQTLKLISVTFFKSENKILNSIVQIPKMSLQSLRHVDCENSDPKIFSLFTSNSNIQVRKIRLSSSSDDSTFNYCDFIEFVSQQSKLKCLTINGLTSNNSNVLNTHCFMSCQLESLAVEKCNFSDRDHMRNLIQLIKNQKNLRFLKISATPLPRSMDVLFTYKQILANHIKEAELDIGSLTFFHSNNFTCRSIRHLTLYGKFAFEVLPIFINFIAMFPNVTKLKLISDSPIGDKYLFHVLSSLKNLEKLAIPGFTSRRADSNFSNLSILDSKLNTLELDFLDNDVKFFGWKNISSNLKAVEKLVIKRCYGKVSNEIVDVIVKKMKLKHLELGTGVVSSEILRTIIFNSDELKRLKIAKEDFEKLEDKVYFEKLFSKSHLQIFLCDKEYFEG